MSQNPQPIVVVGSLNVDTFMLVKGLPQAGETIAAKGVKKAFGGKVSEDFERAVFRDVRIAFRIDYTDAVLINNPNVLKCAQGAN